MALVVERLAVVAAEVGRSVMVESEAAATGSTAVDGAASAVGGAAAGAAVVAASVAGDPAAAAGAAASVADWPSVPVWPKKNLTKLKINFLETNRNEKKLLNDK